MVFQSIATPSPELEYVSDRDGGFKRSLGRCKLLTRWALEYFDQTPTRADLLLDRSGLFLRCQSESALAWSTALSVPKKLSA